MTPPGPRFPLQAPVRPHSVAVRLHQREISPAKGSFHLHRRGGERERGPQLVELPVPGAEEGGTPTAKGEGSPGGGARRKGGRNGGPWSGNGAALRHSDTRAHVKWRVHARGSSLLRTIIRAPLLLPSFSASLPVRPWIVVTARRLRIVAILLLEVHAPYIVTCPAGQPSDLGVNSRGVPGERPPSGTPVARAAARIAAPCHPATLQPFHRGAD